MQLIGKPNHVAKQTTTRIATEFQVKGNMRSKVCWQRRAAILYRCGIASEHFSYQVGHREGYLTDVAPTEAEYVLYGSSLGSHHDDKF